MMKSLSDCLGTKHCLSCNDAAVGVKKSREYLRGVPYGLPNAYPKLCDNPMPPFTILFADTRARKCSKHHSRHSDAAT